MKPMRLTPIADAISRVFWFWREQPDSPMLRENPISQMQLRGYAVVDEGHHVLDSNKWRTAAGFAIAGTSVALRDDTLYTDGERVGTVEQFKMEAITGPTIAEMVANGVLSKPKRIRSRHRPLTVADIAVGGVYVPKRGNNKSPNYRITDLDYAESKQYGVFVSYEREGVEDSDDSANMVDFLALVARRADA